MLDACRCSSCKGEENVFGSPEAPTRTVHPARSRQAKRPLYFQGREIIEHPAEVIERSPNAKWREKREMLTSPNWWV